MDNTSPNSVQLFRASQFLRDHAVCVSEDRDTALKRHDDGLVFAMQNRWEWLIELADGLEQMARDEEAATAASAWLKWAARAPLRLVKDTPLRRVS